ncbi:MAG: response regulator [Chloroflexota bacterium]|nr:response regulator [Chloroflexota bacterium]
MRRKSGIGGHPTHTVLVVDDEPAIRQLLDDLLSAEGHAVLSATDGRNALEQLRSGARPCVILLDLMMPLLDGWQTAQELRGDPELRTIPFAVIAANPRYEAEAYRMGAAAWLGKPLDVAALLETVEHLCQAA